jgi:transposase
MKLYGGIDLHSNNSVIAIIDESDQVIYQRRLANDLELILTRLLPYKSCLQGLVVESTYNWYWLVGGLLEAGYTMHLANTAAIRQYEGIKHTDDLSDAQYLAHLLRLGILPEGYIYPKEERAVRDLLRKHAQLVHQKVRQILSIQNLFSRTTGCSLSGKGVKKLDEEQLEQGLGIPEVVLAAKSSLAVMRCLEAHIESLEQAVLGRVRMREEFKALLSVPGIGPILGLTIMLETGDIRRFQRVGDFSSYCRCVGSKKLSNGKLKGSANTKCGNKYKECPE